MVFPLCSIWNASFAKVENVVNPPHSPVVSNKHIEFVCWPCLENIPNSKPKMKLPNIFINNVPHGNPCPQRDFISVDM